MADEQSDRSRAQDAIYAKIAEVADAVNVERGVGSSGAVLKDLAEAYAWVSNPSQSH